MSLWNVGLLRQSGNFADMIWNLSLARNATVSRDDYTMLVVMMYYYLHVLRLAILESCRPSRLPWCTNQRLTVSRSPRWYSERQKRISSSSFYFIFCKWFSGPGIVVQNHSRDITRISKQNYLGTWESDANLTGRRNCCAQ